MPLSVERCCYQRASKMKLYLLARQREDRRGGVRDEKLASEVKNARRLMRQELRAS